MNCKWCGSAKHQSKRCPTRKLVKFLTGKEEVVPLGLPIVIVTDEEHLVDTVEEAHMLIHIKKEKSKP